MPCFLVGENAAKTLSAVLGVPRYAFSHQAGHIAAGLYSCGNASALGDEFLFFHVSGGTTEGLSVRRKNGGFDTEIVCRTADISAGQLIDRVGVMLGAGFPAGGELEKAAAGFSGDIRSKLGIKPTMKDGALNLSGFENSAKAAYDDGASVGEIALATLRFTARSLVCALEYAYSVCGKLPTLFAGGVMRNEYIKSSLADENVFFASREFSSDNAAGTVLLTRDRFENGEK